MSTITPNIGVSITRSGSLIEPKPIVQNEKISLQQNRLTSNASNIEISANDEQSVILSISTISSGKSFSEVASDARETIDSNSLKYGVDTNVTSTHVNELRKAYEGIDRRSMFAIASNKDGLFSEFEQGMAQSFMTEEQSAAMGLIDGSFHFDGPAAMKRAIKFWDNVSAEEKVTFNWAQQRAAMQFTYEVLSEQEGQVPENLDSEDPLAKMIKSALDAQKALDDPSIGLEDMAGYKRAVEYFENRNNVDIDAQNPNNILDITA